MTRLTDSFPFIRSCSDYNFTLGSYLVEFEIGDGVTLDFKLNVDVVLLSSRKLVQWLVRELGLFAARFQRS